MTKDKKAKTDIPDTEILKRSDGIVQVKTSDRTYSEVEIRAIHENIGNLTDNQKALSLVIPSTYTYIDNDARRYLSTPEAGVYFIAKAYFIQSLAQRIIANFISKVKGYDVPVKFFNHVEPAVVWLKSFNQNTGNNPGNKTNHNQ